MDCTTSGIPTIKGSGDHIALTFNSDSILILNLTQEQLFNAACRGLREKYNLVSDELIDDKLVTLLQEQLEYEIVIPEYEKSIKELEDEIIRLKCDINYLQSCTGI